MKKRNLALLILLFGSTTSIASVMDPDCDAEKAAKAAATKAVVGVGVGGRCTPKEALKDTAVDAGKDKLPDEGMAGKAVDAMTPEKEKKTVKDVTKKFNKD
ncbi:hypothetical protein MZJ31_001160 [Vibrio parahaemolyticus]|uniref:hypothetical protein n=1 Tax=Vibrio parahaemolyticus TaxID=670 RepID=UPI0006A6A960|nr:hypothetical protein [Vibrio parahaemolyticus]EGQ7822121.1 hypothetical protein [Vibrio parahaemolyticus]EGR0213339.1 hypothetical protein [Vibrio parahaemolyticus]EGR0907858.1 hypothetical protein [Vibrio parahaemolyticus]EGR5927142.1 hypothetical protein [Vibrio parahaemolyticus]EGV3806393.1 hypothetical protein [Vibrio parahaemolyticus]